MGAELKGKDGKQSGKNLTRINQFNLDCKIQQNKLELSFSRILSYLAIGIYFLSC